MEGVIANTLDDTNNLLKTVDQKMETINNTGEAIITELEKTEKLSVRFRDFIIRIIISIKNLFTCSVSCGKFKSSCCEKKDHHDTYITNIYSTPSTNLKSVKSAPTFETRD